MQYILTQEEMDEINTLRREMKRLPSVEKLQKACSHIADTMPVEVDWIPGDAQPWGCILTQEYEHYCDECPVQDICPKDHKSWSK